MKKVLTLFIVLVCVNSLFAQLAKESWSFGFGGTFPRFQASDVRPIESNYGGFISLQKNVSEDVGLRALGYFNHISGRIPGGIYTYSNGSLVPSSTEEMSTNVLGVNFDMLYYFSPCSSISPYFYTGIGVLNSDPDWGEVVNSEVKSKTTLDIQFGLGAEWVLSSDWNLKTELGYHSVDSQIDGIINNNRQGLFGSNADAFITFNVGFQWYFSKGEPSQRCDMYSGVKSSGNSVDYEKIERMIEKHIPEEVTKETIIEKPVYPKPVKNVLVGIKFDSDSHQIPVEYYPALFNVVKTMLLNPDMKVEVQGHTDNTGSADYNMKLSQKRAEKVKEYIILNGISSDRLKAIGYGETKPLTDNTSENGKAMNRRIEFKVIN